MSGLPDAAIGHPIGGRLEPRMADTSHMYARRRRTAIAAVAGVVLALLTGSVPAHADDGKLHCDNQLAQAGHKPGRNPERIFIGVRGSGESATYLYGLGKRSAALFEELRKAPGYADRLQCTAAVLETYQARGVPTLDESFGTWSGFVDDMFTNADALADPLLVMAAKYPRARFVVSGFSKGAVVAQLGVAKAVQTNPDLARRLDALVLISSPLADVTDPRLHMSGDSNWQEPRTGVITLASSIARTEQRTLAVRALMALAGNVHKIIPDACLMPGCQSLKRISLEVAKRRPPVEAMLESILRAQRAGALSQSNSVTQLRRSGVRVISVCYTGDAVCAPIGRKDKSTWFNMRLHSDKYSSNADWAIKVAEQITSGYEKERTQASR
jgi:hypothetical protein